MMRGILTAFSFISAIFFPWPITALFVFAVSLFEPLMPLAIGLFADTLYYAPQVGGLPLFTLWGALAAGIAFFVRTRLKASIIGR